MKSINSFLLVSSLVAACAGAPSAPTATEPAQPSVATETQRPTETGQPTATSTVVPTPYWLPDELSNIEELLPYVKIENGFYEPNENDLRNGDIYFFVVDLEGNRVFGNPFGQSAESLGVDNAGVETYLFGRRLPTGFLYASDLVHIFLLDWGYNQNLDVLFTHSNKCLRLDGGVLGIDGNSMLQELDLSQGVVGVFWTDSNGDHRAHVVYPSAISDPAIAELIADNPEMGWSVIVTTLDDGSDCVASFLGEIGASQDQTMLHE